MKRPGIIVAARMGSSRLPGKALMEFHGTTVLGAVLVRCAATGLHTVAATSDSTADEAIDEALSASFDIYTGSEIDVLGRMIHVAEACFVDPIIRVTGDCPFAEPGIILRVLSEWFRSGLDIASNVNPTRTFAKGLDVEVVSVTALQWLHGKADCSDEEREHVTLGLYRRGVPVEDVVNDGSWPGADEPALCVDTAEDLARLREMSWS